MSSETISFIIHVVMAMLDETLLDKNEKYIVGVSGGVDSMALLDMLIKRDYHIVVLHMNYHFRNDSDIDEKLVFDYCQKHHIDFYVEHGQCEDYQNGNFEMKAREMRYNFYHQIGEKLGINKVILAHHFNDYIETVIMQLQRNNIQGYLGIKEVSYVQNMHIIRPLLKVTKERLQQYCLDHHVMYHDDYTNFDLKYTRNRIRHQDINHYDIDDLYHKAVEHNQKYFHRIESLKDVFYQYDKNGYLLLDKIDRENLADVIYYMVKKDVYPPYISQSLIDEIIKQLDSSKPNVEIALPVNFVFIKEYNNIRVRKKEIDDNYCVKYDKYCFDENIYYRLTDQGHLHDGVFLTEKDFPITIRNFRAGDQIKTSGGTKKVSRLFIDKKISKENRKWWPILLNSQNEIILIPHIAKNIDYLYTKPNIFVVKLDASK